MLLSALDPRWHTLICTTGGSGRLVTAGRRERLVAGTIWIAPAGWPHDCRIERAPWQLAWVCLAPDNRWHFEPKEPSVAPSDSAAEISHVLRRIAAEAESRQAEHALAMETCARLLHLLLKREIQARHMPPLDTRQLALGQLFQQVREHPGEHWTLALLQRASGLAVGPERLRQLCVACLGKTPLQLVTDIRMEISRELLSATDYHIYTVAGMVG
ncbi:MAG: AraC family ligand binding domain-containing protein [Limisphaerales bacterium]